jgi:hypothetical protein
MGERRCRRAFFEGKLRKLRMGVDWENREVLNEGRIQGCLGEWGEGKRKVESSIAWEGWWVGVKPPFILLRGRQMSSPSFGVRASPRRAGARLGAVPSRPVL